VFASCATADPIPVEGDDVHVKMKMTDWVSRPAAKVLRVARTEGLSVVAARGLRRVANRFGGPQEQFPLFLEDVISCPEAVTSPSNWRRSSTAEPLVVNWVSTPPGPGSGGHTTMLRIVEHLEKRGHECRLYFYDRYLGDVRDHERVVRTYWPSVRATVYDARLGQAPADAVFASSWQSAHIVAHSNAPGRRFYLVQDFEPAFYPVSSEQILAESTYRFGFHGITAGGWLATKLKKDYGMQADPFEFGCDSDVYRVSNLERRNGVVFYAKPDVPRRAYVLGVLALAAFAVRHPEMNIHFYGNESARLPFRVIDHGQITPPELNELYNQCAAGLSLSLTNVSLVPWEMLASGCIPVVNDAEHNRLVLTNPDVRYAEFSPAALADALCQLVEEPDHATRAIAASERVRQVSWEGAGDLVESVLRRELRS
jgi:O-antigen biosynthesis protein